MDKEEELKLLEERCFAARISMLAVFKRAGLSSATLARWRKNPESMRASNLGRVEAVLDETERERNA